jgi:hypothetical protein
MKQIYTVRAYRTAGCIGSGEAGRKILNDLDLRKEPKQ